MACAKYEAQRQELVAAMVAEDKAHMEPIRPEKKRVERIQQTRSAVELVVARSRWHVQECEKCKAEGNEPFERAPL